MCPPIFTGNNSWDIHELASPGSRLGYSKPVPPFAGSALRSSWAGVGTRHTSMEWKKRAVGWPGIMDGIPWRHIFDGTNNWRLESCTLGTQSGSSDSTSRENAWSHNAGGVWLSHLITELCWTSRVGTMVEWIRSKRASLSKKVGITSYLQVSVCHGQFGEAQSGRLA